MRRTARVSSKARTAPDQPPPPSAADTDFWKSESSAPPDAQWLRTLDAPSTDADPAFDLAAPQPPIADLVPDEPVEPVPAAPAVPACAAPLPDPVADAWVAVDAVAPVPESHGDSWVAAVPPVDTPPPAGGAWTVADAIAVTPPTDAPEEWVMPGAVVAPAPPRAAAPLETDAPPASMPEPVAAPEAEVPEVPVTEVAEVPEPAAEAAAPSGGSRRAGRSLFGYTKPEPEVPAAVEAPVGEPVVAAAPAAEAPFYETAAYEATAELVPERAPEGAAVTEWLQPASDDLLPQF